MWEGLMDLLTVVAKSCVIAAVALDVIAEIHSIRKAPPPSLSFGLVVSYVFSLEIKRRINIGISGVSHWWLIPVVDLFVPPAWFVVGLARHISQAFHQV